MYQKYKLTYCEYFFNLLKMFNFSKIAYYVGMRGEMAFSFLSLSVVTPVPLSSHFSNNLLIQLLLMNEKLFV